MNIDNTKIASLEEVITDYSNGLHDFTVNGKCSGCGGCCSNVLPLTQKEIDRIHKYISNHNIKRQNHIPSIVVNGAMDMMCPFLDTSKEKKCTIYDARPMICREFICNKWGNHEKSKMSFWDVRIVNMVEEFYG